jgi:hypothetical protein
MLSTAQAQASVTAPPRLASNIALTLLPPFALALAGAAAVDASGGGEEDREGRATVIAERPPIQKTSQKL